MSTTLFQKIFKRKNEEVGTFELLPMPTALPKIAASNAAEICAFSEPLELAKSLLVSQPTPVQFLAALQEKLMGEEMVKTLAHGLPDREGVWWATQGVERVVDTLPPSDVQALRAAQNWVRNPTAGNREAAAAAATQTDPAGPGALAAQAAAWSQLSATAQTGGPVVPPRMTPHAVVGSVLLCSAIKAHPTLAAPGAIPKMSKVQMPSPQIPAVAMPQLPNLAAPGIAIGKQPPQSPQAPSLTLPKVNAPALAVPEVSMPKVAMPSAPSAPSPALNKPAVPDLAAINLPNLSTPGDEGMRSAHAQLAAGSVDGRKVAGVILAAAKKFSALAPTPPEIPPNVHRLMFQQKVPFIAIGLDIAAGRNSWA